MRGATRGDGRVGENVTQNLRTIKSDPAADRRRARAGRGARRDLPAAHGVRGAERGSAPRPARPPSPTRATRRPGSLRQLDPAVTASRPLSIWCYGDRRARRGVELAHPHGGARLAARARLQGRTRRSRSHEGVEEVVERCRWWEERRERARLRDRRRRRQGRRAALLARARRGRARAALGHRLEVPADDRHHEAQASRLERGADRQLVPFAQLEPVRVSGVTVSRRPSTTRRTWRARTSARATRSWSRGPAT